MSFESTKDEESRLHIREESNNKRIVVISDDSESEYSSLGSLKEDLVPFTQETSSSLPSLTCSSSSSSSTSNNPPLQLLSMTSEISKKLEMKEINITKQVEMIIPESKSSNLFSSLSFSCQVTCTHYLNYRLYIEEDIHYSFADLNKLDIILGSNGSLDIQCSFLLNGLDNVLEYPTWFQRPLNKVMADCGFINDDITEDSKGCLHYKIKKAFVTTPLSYLLDKEAPYGTLGKIEITFDWITTKSREFQTTWKRKFNLDSIANYMEQAFINIIIRKTSYMYPLIFSNYYTKKLTQTISYLPNIAQSLHKIYITSKSTISINDHDFSHSILEKLEVIKKNTDIMNPYQFDSKDDEIREDMFPTYLILGMYHSIKNANKQRSQTTTRTVAQDPPNALYTVARLWSSTCSPSNLFTRDG